MRAATRETMIRSALKAAFANKQLPDLESGNMVFMMSKSAYLFDAGDHNGPHVMFFTALKDGKDWGADAHGSPVFAGPYWFLSSKEPSRRKGCRRFLCSQSKLQSGPTERRRVHHPHTRRMLIGRLKVQMARRSV